MISLEQAKQLVALLEDGQQDQADELVLSVAQQYDNPMLKEVGALTRELHNSLNDFRFDARMSAIAKEEIPDARDRLEYVMVKTEQAANKTMDAVESLLPIADKLHESLLEIRPTWNQLMAGRIELAEFKALCHNVDALLAQVEGDSTELRSQLTDILMAQDFQDLTGQIISRVITLVHEVEDRLVDILTTFGVEQTENKADADEKSLSAPEGPILNPHERDDAVASQDDVDDLLSSLGF
jgi:chemotaxis protein CheZ